ncbi:MAG: ABC transporter ATP-binding protein [Candidatus Brocadiaceae bacterium]|nr:ABC transporter ATP-binding protein [Candidatus Brocadiaceae bacterium]
MSATERPTVLEVSDLRTEFRTENGIARAVDGVSFRIGRGETFCLVGESGCGKSVTALSILRLVPSPPGRITSGRVLFGGRDLRGLSERRMRRVRGAGIGMIFQEPMTALNPVFTVGNQVAEAVRAHADVSRSEARRRALDLMERVYIRDAARRYDDYPHQMSGGMLQRVMIAMALVGRPDLLIADEPTTALDVTVQARILDLLRELRDEMGMAVLLITHDMGVVAEVADTVAVMYAGRIVETADVRSVFRTPRHPYLVSLLRSLPRRGGRGGRLAVIPGHVPDPRRFPPGCRFHPRCFMAAPACADSEPELRGVGRGHRAACLRLPGYWADGAPPDPALIATDAERMGHA